MRNKTILYGLLVSLAATFLSCEKDDENTPATIQEIDSLYVQVQGDRIKYRDLHSLNDTTLTVSIAYKNDATSNEKVTVTVGADLSAVNEYNKTNGEEYLPFPADAFVLEKTSVSIDENTNSSSFNVMIKPSALAIEDGEAYLLPLTLSIEDDDTNVRIDVNYRTVYLVIYTDLIHIEEIWDEDIAKDKWTVAGFSSEWQNNIHDIYKVDKALDGNINTYWHTDLTGLPQWFSIDMHGNKQISGFTLTIRQDDADSHPKSVLFEVSKNNVKWKTALLVPELPKILTTQTLSLEQPVVARYFKVTVLSVWSTNPYTYIAELSAFSEN
jgi:hypothetical protein